MTPPDILDRAKFHWRDLATRLVLPGTAYDGLVAAYSEPHRRYHTLDHVVEMLDCLGESRHLAAFPDVIALAVWFHDAVYAEDVSAGANEQASADMLAAICTGPESAPAQAMILHSTHHGPSDDPDTRLFCDLDLYRLGVGYDEFRKHSDNVRHEYTWVEDAPWVRGRGDFLSAMLARATIYQTGFWRGRLEAQARDNIARAIAGLEQG